MYGHPGVGRGHSQVPDNGATDENFPNSTYGYSMSQPAHGAPYYTADMAERRPLQPMQLDGPSLIEKIAQRQQQLMHSYQGRAQSQSSMCLPSHSQPLERQPSTGFTAGARDRPAYGQVGDNGVDFPLSGQLPQASYPQQDMGYHPGARYPQVQDADRRHPYAGVNRYPDGHQGGLQGGLQGTGMGLYGSNVFCDSPPAMYAGFTPSRTSTPISPSTAAGSQQGYVLERPVQRHGRQAHMPQPEAEARPQVWAKPVAMVSFDQSVIAFPGPGRARAHREQGPAGAAGHGGVSSATPSYSAAPAPSKLGGGPRTATTPMKAPPSAGPSSRPATPSSSAVTSPLTVATPTKSSSARPAGRVPPTAEIGIRLLTGTVDNILTWGRKLEEEARPNVLFEIVGSLDSVVRGQWYSSRLVSLRSLEGSATLSAVFWEIDMPLAPPPTGSIVSCLCRLGPKWPQPSQMQMQRRMPRMQMLKMRAVSAGQVAHLKRLAYVSGHAVQQGALAAAAPASAPSSAPPAPPPSPLKQTLISSYAAPRTSRT